MQVSWIKISEKSFSVVRIPHENGWKWPFLWKVGSDIEGDNGSIMNIETEEIEKEDDSKKKTKPLIVWFLSRLWSKLEIEYTVHAGIGEWEKRTWVEHKI